MCIGSHLHVSRMLRFAAGYEQPADFSREAFGQFCVKTHDDHLNTTNKFGLTVKAPYLSVGALGVSARVFACFAKETTIFFNGLGRPSVSYKEFHYSVMGIWVFAGKQ